MTGPILPITTPALADPARPAAPAGGGGFADVLSSAIRSVDKVGQDASASVERFLTGDGEDLHTTILATTRAELAFDMFLQTRNKVVSAYQEIMRMQM
jgi:flagellar hook-basal body complex protein FliE